MNFVYKRRGGPLISWENGYPPRQTRAGETQSLGDILRDLPPAAPGMPGAPERISGIPESIMSYAGMAAGAFHGYRRHKSLAWAIGWSILGGMFPIPTAVVAVIQGFGKPK